MRYWVINFDKQKAQGPYGPYELKEIEWFGPDSWVAEEEAEAVEAWKRASECRDLKSLFIKKPPYRPGAAAPIPSSLSAAPPEPEEPVEKALPEPAPSEFEPSIEDAAAAPAVSRPEPIVGDFPPEPVSVKDPDSGKSEPPEASEVEPVEPPAPAATDDLFAAAAAPEDEPLGAAEAGTPVVSEVEAPMPVSTEDVFTFDAAGKIDKPGVSEEEPPAFSEDFPSLDAPAAVLGDGPPPPPKERAVAVEEAAPTAKSKRRRWVGLTAAEAAFLAAPALAIVAFLVLRGPEKEAPPPREAPAAAQGAPAAPSGAVRNPRPRLRAGARKPRPRTEAAPAAARKKRSPRAVRRPAARRGPEAVILARGFPVRSTALKECPRDLSAIGAEKSPGGWGKIRTIEQGYRCSAMMAVSVWIGKVARVKNVDRAAATAMIRDDIENWGGLDKLYSVKWTAQAAAGGKYRVKARIHDLLGVRCGEKYLLRTAASALPGAGAARTEVHPFEIDLAAMTLRPLSPRAWMAVDFDAYSAWSRRRSAAGKRALGRDADARAFAPAYSRGSRGRVKLPAARPARKKPARKVRRRLKRKKPAKKKAAAPAPALPGLEGLLPPAKPAKKRPAKEPSPRGAIKKGDIREMSVEDFERYLRGGKP